MDKQYKDDNRGVLYKNTEKREGKQDADYEGFGEIGGNKYWLNAWINTAKETGEKYMVVRFKPKSPLSADVVIDEPEAASGAPF